MENLKDKFRGCLVGGAAGDALGYAIEFLDEKRIFNKYGKTGITEYSLDPISGKALISDDTQMTLFTAFAVLFAEYRFQGRGIAANPSCYANMTCQDWLVTQEMTYEEAKKEYNYPEGYIDYPDGFISVLLKDVPELYKRRAPGLTCLSALGVRRKQRKKGKQIYSFIEDKINNSKGCGGIMRVAPIGFLNYREIECIDKEGAECAAITHSHSLGYMPAAVLAHIVHRCLYNELNMTLNEIIIEARDTVAKIFAGDEHIDELISAINDAIELSENNATDLNNIHRLGEGWVAEETLAIAIYCSLRYQDDFSKGIIAAVNHKGDSDSTGAVAGNILGAWLGYDNIENKWKENLEIIDTIIKISDATYSQMFLEEYDEI